jgi:large subunit ribosomal protein L24
MASRKAPAARPPRMKIRSGDHVEVISGKDRGKQGRVLRVDTKHERVFVEHLNMIKRHTRPQQVAGAQSETALGGVIEREGPIHVSNVMLLDAKGKRTRVGIERENGQRFRVARSTGARLD